MSAIDPSAEPEQVIAELKRRRRLSVMVALGGIAVGLGTLLTATWAMYTKDPGRELSTDRSALQPQGSEPRR